MTAISHVHFSFHFTQDEQDANRRNFEVDLVLNEEVESLDAEADVHFAVELESMTVGFQTIPADDEKAESFKLSTVPKLLAKQMDAFHTHRSSPLNRQREGVSVMDITVSNDRM